MVTCTVETSLWMASARFALSTMAPLASALVRRRGPAWGATLRLNGLEDSDTAFSEASKAWKADLAILRNNSTPQQLSHFDKEPWFPLARQLSEKLISNFADSPDDSAGFREELALVQLVYCLSVFSIPRWNRTQRMRLVVWMAACRKFLGWQDE